MLDLEKVFLWKILLKGSGVLEDQYKAQTARCKCTSIHWKCRDVLSTLLVQLSCLVFRGDWNMLTLCKALLLSVKVAKTQISCIQTHVIAVMLYSWSYSQRKRRSWIFKLLAFRERVVLLVIFGKNVKVKQIYDWEY